MKTIALTLGSLVPAAVFAVTTYTWKGSAPLELNSHRIGNADNWQGDAAPVSGDDVVLDFGSINTTGTYTISNDIVGLRIRGFKISCDTRNMTYNLRGEKMTLVASGSGSDSSPDSDRKGDGNFFIYRDSK